MRQVQIFFMHKMHKIIDEDPELAENQEMDNNYVNRVFTISYIHKIVQQVCILFSCSYFFGILWYIICKF